MYKPSKKLVAKGIIPERQPYFNEYGYEYTLYIQDHSVLAGAMQGWLDAEKMRGVKYKFFPDEPVFVIVGYGWKLEVHRTAAMENAASYLAFFSRWEVTGNVLNLGDDMNRVLTALETNLLAVDPLTWVRDVPQERHVTNGIMSRPEIWEGKWPDTRLTREAAAEKKLAEGYLADRLNAAGFAVNGGTPMAHAYNVPEHPLVAARVQKNLERAEAAKNAPAPEEKKRTCTACGAQIRADAKFCPHCGAAVVKSLDELDREAESLKQYPPMFVVEVGEPLNPFIHACIDENKNILPEPQDHSLTEIPLAGVVVNAKKKGEKQYTRVYASNVNRDNFLYVTDSRLALINRKYNKNEAGSWIGFGGLTSYAVASLLSGAEKAIKAAQRKDKALAGHIRYEWIGIIGYRRKQKMLEDNCVRVVYKDMEGTTWNVEFDLTRETDPELLANDILRRTAAYRGRMRDDRAEKMQAFITRYRDGAEKIVPEADPAKTSSVTVPEFFFASKGSAYRPED